MPVPETPFRESVLPAVNVTGPPGLIILMPPHAIPAPSALVVFPAATVESQTPKSELPGTALPVQLEARLRSSLLFALYFNVFVEMLGGEPPPPGETQMLSPMAAVGVEGLQPARPLE